jgi:PAS domain S-box-containing protein
MEVAAELGLMSMFATRDAPLASTIVDLPTDLDAQRLAATYEYAALAISEVDAEGRLLRVNEAVSAITGYPREELLGRRVFDFTVADDRDFDVEAYVHQIAGEQDRYVVEKRLRRKDGREVWVSVTSSTLRDAAGRFLYGIRVMHDITERKRAEQHQKVLIGELNHRVKNTLATVQSIAAQTFRSGGDPRELLRAFEGRLFALSRAHDQLARECWEMADLHATLEGIFAPYGTGEKERVRLIGEPVRLTPQAGVAFAMVLHELATNAAKYGALSQPDGTVEVKWSVSNSGLPPRLMMVWQETGGPPVTPPKRAGFGSRFVDRAVCQELNGKTERAYDSGGLRCSIEVPLPSS